MKILVISDSHGNVINLNHVMGFGKKIGARAVIHCGDWDNIKSTETVLSYGLPLYTVLGNADIDGEIEEFLKFNARKFEPDFLVAEIDKRRIGITHRPSNNKKYFTDKKLDIIFNGHYHSAEGKVVEFIKIIRPGALINGINFAIYETETNEVEFIKEDQNE